MKALTDLVKILITAQHSVRILHWKSCGSGFDTAHKATDEYVEKLSDFIDQAQEICLIYGENPTTLSEAVYDSGNLLIDPEISYTLTDVYTKLYAIFSEIIVAYTKAMGEDISQSVKSELESSQYYFILESMYKMKRTLLAEI